MLPCNHVPRASEKGPENEGGSLHTVFCTQTFLLTILEGVNHGRSLERKTVSIIYAMYRFINEVIIHQIFSLARDWSKRVT